MPRYSVEKPIAGATTAYKGRKSMVKMKDPGIAATVYFVQRLQEDTFDHKELQRSRGGKKTYSEINAAFPSTVRRTARYSVVPQNQ